MMDFGLILIIAAVGLMIWIELSLIVEELRGISLLLRENKF